MAAIKLLMNKTGDHKDFKNYIRSWLLENYSQKRFPGSEMCFVFIASNYFLSEVSERKDSLFLNKLRVQVNKSMAIIPGATPLYLELPDTSRKYHSLEEIQQKDIVLLFYDSDCGPCKYVKSQLISLLNRLDSRNICIYAVNLDENKSKWINFMRGTGPEWIHLDGSARKEQIAQTYMFEFLPAIVLIGSDKKIQASNLSYTEIENILRSKYAFKRKN